MASRSQCGHDPDTPVTLLCDDCREKRRRVRDRINRRKARAQKRGLPARPQGTAVLPGSAVADLTDALASVAEMLNRAEKTGLRLTGLEQQLVYNLRSLHDTLTVALAPAADELVEVNRPRTQYPETHTPATPKFTANN